jgi:hypothetical protein
MVAFEFVISFLYFIFSFVFIGIFILNLFFSIITLSSAYLCKRNIDFINKDYATNISQNFNKRFNSFLKDDSFLCTGSSFLLDASIFNYKYSKKVVFK